MTKTPATSMPGSTQPVSSSTSTGSSCQGTVWRITFSRAPDNRQRQQRASCLPTCREQASDSWDSAGPISSRGSKAAVRRFSNPSNATCFAITCFYTPSRIDCPFPSAPRTLSFSTPVPTTRTLTEWTRSRACLTKMSIRKTHRKPTSPKLLGIIPTVSFDLAPGNLQDLRRPVPEAI